MASPRGGSSGAGTVLGVNWLWYKSDTIQTDDVANPGSGDGVGPTSLIGRSLNPSNVLVDQAGMPTAQFVITEAVPEPSGIILATLAGALVVAYGRRARGASISQIAGVILSADNHGNFLMRKSIDLPVCYLWR